MTDETTKRIEAIRERWSKATPGPWALDIGSLFIFGPDYHHVGDVGIDGPAVCEARGWGAESVGLVPVGTQVCNGRAIASAPEDVAFLLAELEDTSVTVGVLLTALRARVRTSRCERCDYLTCDECHAIERVLAAAYTDDDIELLERVVAE